MGIHMFAGEDRQFDLPLHVLQDLEEACGAPIGKIYLSVAQTQFYAKHLYNIIRFGLIGGGMAAVEAKRLIDARFDTTPFMKHHSLCMAILLDLFEGVEGDGGTGEPEMLNLGAFKAAFVKAGVDPSFIDKMTLRQFSQFAAAMKGNGGKEADPDAYMAMLRDQFPDLYKEAMNAE